MSEWVEVRVTDSGGVLVDRFSANCAGAADERVRKLVAKFARCEPDEVLTVQRSDEGTL
jgi:hypothetical protein